MKLHSIFIAIVAMSIMACDSDSKSASHSTTFELKFDQVFGHQEFVLGREFKLPNNETIRLDVFKYIVGNFEFESTSGELFTVDTLSSYLLVDEQKANETRVEFTVPFSNVKSLRFKLGVDAGTSQKPYATLERYPALNYKRQGHEMGWNWNVGFIFFKTEGSSNLQKSLTYHIGLYGRDGSVNNIREVVLDLSSKQFKGSRNSIHITADVSKVWAGISTASFSRVMTSPVQSPKIADNYAKMFTLEHIH